MPSILNHVHDADKEAEDLCNKRDGLAVEDIV